MKHWLHCAFVGVCLVMCPVVASAQRVIVSPCGINPVAAAISGQQLLVILARQIEAVAAAISCRDTSALEPMFRAGVRCTLQKMDRGGWGPVVVETYRSSARQAKLFTFGRTAPGPKVTNAASAITSVHGYRMAVDIASRKHGWDSPRFFRWLMIHAESCGLTSGAAWRTLPDRPHIQTGKWAGSPPQWARVLLQRDSLFAVWARLGL